MNTFNIFTLFPDMFKALDYGILGIAKNKGILNINTVNIRDYSEDKHKKVDDYPYGGGFGMLMMCQPVFDAIKSVPKAHTIYMSPKGTVLTQNRAMELSKIRNINILCGHYEGIDQRIIDMLVDEEISCGDYVVSGGEIPAMILIDCISRLVDNVLPQPQSFIDESHTDNLLECHQYTRPEIYNELSVPSVLLSGHHKNIDEFRLAQSIYLTLLNRPDMLMKRKITKKELKIFLIYYPQMKDDIINFVE
ncbi:MAG: tRNA (guanosine(37)-N1)-methyltransferase TrmD [Clostridia bacterium]|jgi:tRNA (guanine37-N1)-methyltransferase|nr:tRNA (guanosine(37)-N1)-methyltransferase TrmD [Clostridia bacterium]NLV33059.1 tRNA (guanosine(37)-N1)-methyltransferase TrmD [Clostridiaceae bacterium]